MLDLLTQIIQFIWELLPRPTIVGPMEESACFWFGRYGRRKGPGLYLIWPLIQYWRVHTVASQICETAIIAVTSSDDKDWQWRLGIEYEIHDILKYETGQFSGQNHLEMLGGAALVRIISQLSSDQIKEAGVWRICNKIKTRIIDSADQRGMKVIGVRPIMASRCRAFFVSQAERLVD
jgi:hypothetical protein